MEPKGAGLAVDGPLLLARGGGGGGGGGVPARAERRFVGAACDAGGSRAPLPPVPPVPSRLTPFKPSDSATGI